MATQAESTAPTTEESTDKAAPQATGPSASGEGVAKSSGGGKNLLKEWCKATFCYCYLSAYKNNSLSDPGDKPPATTAERRGSADSHVTDHMIPDDSSTQSVSPGRRKSVTFLDQPDTPDEPDRPQSTSPQQQRGVLRAQSSIASQLDELPAELKALEERLTSLFGTGFFKTVDQDDSIEGEEGYDYDGPPDGWGALELKLQVSEQQLKAKISEVEAITENIQATMKQRLTDGFLPFEFELTQFDSLKRRKASFIGPPMYTHPGGYKFRIEVLPGGEGMSEGTHLCVNVVSLKGPFDPILKFPAHFILTIQILNHYSDTGHYTRQIECTYQEPYAMKEIGSEFEFMLRKKLYWNEEKQTLYLYEDKIRFKLTKIFFVSQST